MENYWFYLEPYVYTSFTGDSVFLYNTLDGQYVESANPVIRRIISQTKEKPEGVITLSQTEINKDEVKDFIRQLRDYFMGDLIDTSYSDGSPIQFMPVLNVQTDIERMKSTYERSMGENILLNLNELVFYTDSPSVFPNKYYPSNLPFNWQNENKGDLNHIQSILEQIPHTVIESLTITIVAKGLEDIKNKKTLIDILSRYKAKKKFDLYYKNSITDEVCADKPSVTLNVDFPLDDEKFRNIMNQIGDKKELDKIDYVFFISSLDDMDEADDIIEEYNLSACILMPYYTGCNYDFLKENIFLDKDDLLSEPVSMRKIFLHQSLNIASFGKLHISPAGDVFSDIFSEKLGSLGQQTLLEMLDKEFDSVQAWFRRKGYAPCNECHFQWLCPPPGSYEQLLKKDNLCRIKN